MIWQDLVIAACNIIFLGALIANIFNGSKPALITSISTAIALSIVAFCLLTLSLTVSGVVASLSAICWFILFYQRKYQIGKCRGKYINL